MKCKCNCEHKKVEYCKECQKVHCKDCGQEWPDLKTETQFIPYYPYIYSKPYKPPFWEITWGTNGTINDPDPSITVSSDNYTDTGNVPYTLTA